MQTIVGLQLASWRTYENYTGPLGAQTLTDITGSHFGPNIESSEENGWGQWHRADEKGIGMDRTVATGTGYVGQYRPPVAKIYESLATTPDELVLFFHHVPYTYKLHSGKTVIQYIYDSHYDGAAEVAEFVDQWKSLQGHIDTQRFNDVLARLEYQAGHAIVWRDAICNYFLKKSGIADAQGRAGHFPNRIEAESMQLRGYNPVDVTPWENASQGRAIECAEPQGCGAGYKFTGKEGNYNIAILYFDHEKRRRKIPRSSQRSPDREMDRRRPTPRHENRRRRRHTPHDRGRPSSPRRSTRHRRHARSRRSRRARLHRDCPVILICFSPMYDGFARAELLRRCEFIF